MKLISKYMLWRRSTVKPESFETILFLLTLPVKKIIKIIKINFCFDDKSNSMPCSRDPLGDN